MGLEVISVFWQMTLMVHTCTLAWWSDMRDHVMEWHGWQWHDQITCHVSRGDLSTWPPASLSLYGHFLNTTSNNDVMSEIALDVFMHFFVAHMLIFLHVQGVHRIKLTFFWMRQHLYILNVFSTLSNFKRNLLVYQK